MRELDLRVLSNKVDTCIKRLNEWVDKLDSTDERMSQEKPDELEQLMAEDSSLMETAFECRGDLENFHKSLEDMSALSQSVSPVNVADEGMNQIQSQLQQLKIRQHHASIKLPKLEIPTFNGEKLK